MPMPEPTPLPRLLPYALAYARRGWPVFPLHTPTPSGNCSCGQPCGNPGKHPRTRNGFKQATCDEETIRRWWAQYPDANIGIATGTKSGLLVVDVDPKNGGAGTWTRITLEHDLPPLTVTVDTGSGGWHLFYSRPATPAPVKSKANAIKPGIDTRCDGGYVVAPPSLHVSGQRYKFRPGADPGDDGTDVQPCPDWMYAMLYPEPAAPKQTHLPSSTDDGWLLTAFNAAGLVRRDLGPDRAAVRCPWEAEHSTKAGDNDSATIVFRPSATRTMGHFHCSHAHCNTRTLADVRSVLPQHAIDKANEVYPSKPKDQPEQQPPSDWQSDLIRKPNGDLDPAVANAVSILTHDEQWRGVLAHDEFAGRSIFRKDPPWYAEDAPATAHEQIDDADDVRLTSWLHRRYNLKVGTTTAHDAIEIVCQRHGFHPVRRYLLALEWDGVQRLPTFATTYLGAPPDVHYQSAPLRWFVAAVKRVFEPGCQSDSILVFEGDQGMGKSRMLRTLASDAWFADEIGDPSNKDAAECLRGKWIIEIGELRWKKSDEDTRKAFISRRVDHYRPAYGRRAVDIPRQNVIAASTNETNWQTDATGARRYWVVSCGQIDQDAIERDRDQLWAEARTRYECHEPSWLQDDEVPHQKDALEARREQDPWEDRIAAWLALQTEVTVPDVLTQCMDLEPARQTLGESRRVARVLRVLGWTQTGGKKGPRGKRAKTWAPSGTHDDE